MKKTYLFSALILGLLIGGCSSEPATEGEETTVDGAETTVDETETSETTETTSSSDGVSIVGDWKLSEIDMGMEIPPEQQAMFDAMLAEMLENTTMTFNADGTFQNTATMQGETKTEGGTYVVGENTLTTTPDAGPGAGKDVVFDLNELSANKLSLSVADGETNVSMIFTR